MRVGLLALAAALASSNGSRASGGADQVERARLCSACDSALFAFRFALGLALPNAGLAQFSAKVFEFPYAIALLHHRVCTRYQN